MIQLEDFAAGYYLVPGLEVVPYAGSVAAVQDTVYDELAQLLGEPVVGSTAGTSFTIYPDRHLPAHVAAIPRAYNPRDRGALLVRRRDSVLDLLGIFY
jgi:hypothetical protein